MHVPGPMILLALMVIVIAMVAAVIYAVVRGSRPRPAHPEALPPPPVADPNSSSVNTPPPARADLNEGLRRWRAAGLLSEDQLVAILEYEGLVAAVPVSQPPPSRPRRVPVVAEALGYLGGMLAVLGLSLVVARYWPDMATLVRLGLSGAAALLLLGAGALVREDVDPALARLRGFLWLASTAAAALFAGVLTADALDVDRTESVVLACAGAVTLESGLLWWWRPRPLQQLAFIGGLSVFAGTALDQIATPGAAGIAVWIVGAASLTLGLQRRTPLPYLSEGAGAAAAVVGAMIAASEWSGPGLVFAAATAVGLVALGLIRGPAPSRTDQLLVGIIGAGALFLTVPGTLGYFAEQAGVVTGLATWVCGAGLLLVGAWRLVRLPLVVETFGGVTLIGGAALTGVQAPGFASIFGIVTAVGLIGLGMFPGQVMMSLLGSIGLLINVPWAIAWFFPGEGRAPLLILVAGLLILLVAVMLTRMGGRFRRELAGPREHPRPPSVSLHSS